VSRGRTRWKLGRKLGMTNLGMVIGFCFGMGQGPLILQVCKSATLCPCCRWVIYPMGFNFRHSQSRIAHCPTWRFISVLSTQIIVTHFAFLAPATGKNGESRNGRIILTIISGYMFGKGVYFADVSTPQGPEIWTCTLTIIPLQMMSKVGLYFLLVIQVWILLCYQSANYCYSQFVKGIHCVRWLSNTHHAVFQLEQLHRYTPSVRSGSETVSRRE
jgi:hypothetical protein